MCDRNRVECLNSELILLLRVLQGIVYVVDCCFVKQRAYNPMVGLESLLVAPTSKVSGFRLL
jgi:hypothetical protein